MDEKIILEQAWGREATRVPDGLLDLSRAPIGLQDLEALLRRMPERCLFVRLPGSGPHSGSPRRVPMADIAALATQLAAPQPLHLQAIDVNLYDAGFAHMLERFGAWVGERIPELAQADKPPSLGLFLSSPGAVAPFHADCEHNFLFQVVGDKQVHVWDREDLSIFDSAARERLIHSHDHMLATYRPEIEARARVLALQPGQGLYHPPLAPHWVDTGRSSYSLSLTMTFITPSVQRLRCVHKLNHRLRRLGLRPAPVGQHPRADALKAWLGQGLQRVLQSLR